HPDRGDPQPRAFDAPAHDIRQRRPKAKEAEGDGNVLVQVDKRIAATHTEEKQQRPGAPPDAYRKPPGSYGDGHSAALSMIDCESPQPVGCSSSGVRQSTNSRPVSLATIPS